MSLIRFFRKLFSKPKAPPFEEAFLENVRRFEAHNTRRLELLRSNLSEARRNVLDLIPFLLNEDAEGLPGNDLGRPLSGVSCFTFTPRLQQLAKRYFPEYRIRQRGRPSMAVVFLSVMGSAGTMAFTGESDIDFWVGIDGTRPDPAALAALEKKLRAIEDWAFAIAGLEVHFFVADLERVRRDDYGETGGESCGTALGKLLKDEFYRTAIFLEGRRPYFWAMPVGVDDCAYHDYLALLSASLLFPNARFTDLGHVSAIHPTEYFGAALWQILKGLYSPFKSVIKMGLLDAYTGESEGRLPLCERYKKQLFDTRAEPPDPYLFMVEEVRAFYSETSAKDPQLLLEQCFLIKNFLTAGQGTAEARAQFDRFLPVAEKWGWGRKDLLDVAAFRSWDYERTETLRKRIARYFLDAYKRIRDRTREANVRISDRDLTVIGKKLHCFFAQEPGKVPFEFMLLSAKDITGIVIDETPEGAGRPSVWSVKIAVRGTGGFSQQLLRKFENVMPAIAFCSVNRLRCREQNFMLKGSQRLSLNDAAHLLDALSGFFPVRELDAVSANDTLSAAHATHLYIIPNWNHPQWSYGVTSLFVFFQNTLGELHYDQYHGEKALEWLVESVLKPKVGAARLRGLKWAVHSPREKVIMRKKISDAFEAKVREYVEKAG
ncbi:MAG: class I adenylate cyclase [Fibrobacterota bacterium]